MGHWALQLQAAPALEPVSLAEVKAHVRQDLTADDGLLSALITAARMQIERDTQRQLVTASWLLTMDTFPWWDAASYRGTHRHLPAWQWAEHLPIRIPKPPLQAVSSIQYIDPSGALQTFPSANYQVDTQDEPARVQPVYALYWPITRAQLNAVQIAYTAGWAHTTITAAITAGAQTVTPANMGGINTGQTLEIDTGSSLEVVLVTGTTSTTFTATFAANHAGPTVVSAVPRPLKQAIMLLAGHWFANREAVNDRPLSAMPMAVEALVGSWWTGEYR